MAQTYANPEELISFANQLNQYISNIEEETNRLGSAYSHLCETWKDQKQAAFDERFNELRSAMAAFKNNAQEQIPQLRAMAERLNEYLGV